MCLGDRAIESNSCIYELGQSEGKYVNDSSMKRSHPTGIYLSRKYNIYKTKTDLIYVWNLHMANDLNRNRPHTSVRSVVSST
jgi:hypothetical protein